MAAARSAVAAFVGEAAAPPDRIALVSFAGVAGLDEPLTSDKARVVAAAANLITGAGTRIDLGLEAARRELAGPRHEPGRAKVIVLLTDGVQGGTPSATVVAAADAAKAEGAVLFTVGLGADADVALLRAIASTEGHFYFAPNGDELASIYRRIAVVIPCPTAPPTAPLPTATSTPVGTPTAQAPTAQAPTASASWSPPPPSPPSGNTATPCDDCPPGAGRLFLPRLVRSQGR
jgi:hypothetical protein